jgi:hypothetical protein
VSAALTEALRAHGGALAELFERRADRPPDDPWPPHSRPRGPRTAARQAEYELLLEMIFEGICLHYQPWVPDADLALLLGDQLYALGLVRLSELGDLDAVAELADAISLIAQAQAAGDEMLGGAVWDAAVAAVAAGSTPRHEAAKALARSGDPGAVRAMREASGRDS